MMYNKPQPGDYSPYFEKYLQQLPDEPLMALLEKQPEQLAGILAEVSEDQAEKPYAPGKWNAKQVLGHMMDTERIMLYRALCISRGEQGSLPGFDENAYVAQADFSSRTVESLLQEYRISRQNSLVFFQNLEEGARQRRGLCNGASTTVNGLLGIMVGHERHHLNLFKERYLPVWG
jgi:uncharacterized damage-inducible protein DinB